MTYTHRLHNIVAIVFISCMVENMTFVNTIKIFFIGYPLIWKLCDTTDLQFASGYFITGPLELLVTSIRMRAPSRLYRWPKMNEGVLIRYNFLFKT